MCADLVKESYKELIRKAIQQQKLFELLFGEESKRIWARIPEKHKKRWVKEVLKEKGVFRNE